MLYLICMGDYAQFPQSLSCYEHHLGVLWVQVQQIAILLLKNDCFGRVVLSFDCVVLPCLSRVICSCTLMLGVFAGLIVAALPQVKVNLLRCFISLICTYM